MGAFNASVLSDYPEEQEYLIGDIYLRLMHVSTWTMMTSSDNFDNLANIPLASFTRAVFFVIHIFREQIFSMSENLENFLAMFIELHLMEKKKEIFKVRNEYQLQSKIHGEWLGQQVYVDRKLKYVNNKDEFRQKKVLKILWNKFNQFRELPNMKQIIKIDIVSDRLKPYFFDELENVNIKTKKKRFAVSFEKITNLFENVREIHFINEYKFDNVIMRKLIKQIKKKENKLESVKFLYYDYKDNRNKNMRSIPNDSFKFYHPEKVQSEKLLNVGWELKHQPNGKAGYKINISSKQSK